MPATPLPHHRPWRPLYSRRLVLPPPAHAARALSRSREARARVASRRHLRLGQREGGELGLAHRRGESRGHPGRAAQPHRFFPIFQRRNTRLADFRPAAAPRAHPACPAAEGALFRSQPHLALPAELTRHACRQRARSGANRRCSAGILSRRPTRGPPRRRRHRHAGRRVSYAARAEGRHATRPTYHPRRCSAPYAHAPACCRRRPYRRCCCARAVEPAPLGRADNHAD